MVEFILGLKATDRAKGSTLLELGMGPGKDLDLLKKTYSVTGSDSSKIFVYR